MKLAYRSPGVMLLLGSSLSATLSAGGSAQIEGGQPGAHLGSALAVGDFDGDGFGDLLVSAPDHDGTAADEGRVALHLGSSAGLVSTPIWSITGRQLGARLGTVLASAGDVNGDGRDDALIGAPDFDTDRRERALLASSGAPQSGGTDQGRVWLFLGSPAGLASTAQRVLGGLQDQERFGASLAGAGDVNGDGFDDVLVGATGSDGGRGSIQLYAGSPGGLAGTPLWRRLGAPGVGWGRIVGPAGDVNGDDRDDVLVATSSFGGPCGNQDLFLGTAGGLSGSPVVTHAQGIAAFGATRDFDLDGAPETLYVARCSSGGSWLPCIRDFPASSLASLPVYDPVAVTAGDVNGDGRADLVVSVPSFAYESFHGRVFVHTNLPPFPPVGAFPLYDGDQPGAGWGEALAAIDVDGDGADELFVGAPRQDEGELDEGVVVVFPGRRHAFELVEAAGSPRTSLWPAEAADFDGDGYSDLLTVTGADVNDAEVRYGTPAGLPGSPDAVLVPPPPPQPRPLRDLSFSAGDANGDGFADLALRSFTYETGHGVEFGETVYGLYQGAPAGLPLTPSASLSTRFAFVGDVTGDGYDDALAGNELYLGSNAGLVPAQTLAVPAVYALTGHLNGDGIRDLLLVNGSQLTSYLGSPGGVTFGETWSGFPPLLRPRVVELLDVDGDGLYDLLTYDVGDSFKCRVFRRTASGFERAPQWFESPDPWGSSSSTNNPRILAVFDADGDGFEDLLLSTAGLCSVHTGSPQGLSRAPAWAGALDLPFFFFEDPSSPVADFDGDGEVEFLLRGTFEFGLYEARQP